MDKLTQLLDVCQEKLLALIEKDSSCLTDHIDYWAEQEREQLLLYAARQKGLTRVGFQPVPPLQLSEAKAKDCIMMKLTLQSLYDSCYGLETWTLSQTSHEMYEAAPRCAFKKHGEQVEVRFEGDIGKSVPYVKWGHIYYRDNEGHWHKATANLDYEGLYYVDVDFGRVYYVLFEKEAEKYGKCKPWLIHSTNGTVLTPNRNTNGSPGTNNTQAANEAAPTGCSGEKEARLSFWGSPPQVQNKEVSRRSNPGRPVVLWRPPGSPYVERRGRGRERARGGGGTRQGEGEGEHAAEKRPRSKQASVRNTSGFARGSGEIEGKTAGGSGKAAPNAPGFPFLIFKGNANCLKCWRHRSTKKHRHLFLDFTTVFSWCFHGKGTSCVLVRFADSDQMQTFMDTIPRPKSITAATGTFATLH
ncbi:E2 early protein [Bos taurus papillomavirus 31]|nr:E2 early protein [Bos taurus papillomavirus 31]